MEFSFVIGRPSNESEAEALRLEAEEHDDMLLLEEPENMNAGKTYAFYSHLARRTGPRPKFAFKADDDVRGVLAEPCASR